jgi:hypothetical protein
VIQNGAERAAYGFVVNLSLFSEFKQLFFMSWNEVSVHIASYEFTMIAKAHYKWNVCG